MTLIDHYDKRSKLTYVYESKSYWDKTKKQPRSHRTLIGKRDPNTNQITPTNRKFYGATHLRPNNPKTTHKRKPTNRLPPNIQTNPLHSILPNPRRQLTPIPIRKMEHTTQTPLQHQHTLTTQQRNICRHN
jgi:hypothetical protein